MDPLASAGELETHLRRTVDPTQAEQALALASGAVRAFCGWDIARESTTLTAEGSGTVVVSLPTLHLVAVSEVRVNGVALDIDPIQWAWTSRGQLLRAGGWPRYAQIEVDCTHGFDPIPDLIKLVVLEHAARADSNPEGLIAATVGQVSRTWARGDAAASRRLSELDQRLLSRYAI